MVVFCLEPNFYLMHAPTKQLLFPTNNRLSFRLLALVIFGWMIVNVGQSLYGQDAESNTHSSADSVEQLRSIYEASVDKLRTSIKELTRTEALYRFSDSQESHDHKDHWEALASDSETLFEEIRQNAFALFLAEEQPDADLQQVVRNMATGSINQGQIEISHRICQKLVDLNPEDKVLAEMLIRIEIFNNKFDDAVEFKAKYSDKLQNYDKREQAIFNFIEELKTNFDRELKLREKDKTAELPRVEMKVKGKGTVILELFEDEAPETVANFISLTEAGFYDGIIFHDVANSFLVHGGLVSMKGYEPTGYTIYDECRKPERRHHFRGSISTWTLAEKPDLCGAEFSILRMPGPYFTELNQTVFGRVIQGMEVIDKIQNTKEVNQEDGSETAIPNVIPDMIESMKVIRKRDHDYQPNIVK